MCDICICMFAYICTCVYICAYAISINPLRIKSLISQKLKSYTFPHFFTNKHFIFEKDLASFVYT